MSCSPEYVGQKPARSPEKPSFTQTCSLLSQYLKEKGSFGDLTLGMTCSVEANGAPEMLRPSMNPTMNLFPLNEKRDDVAAPRNLKSMDLFPQQAGFTSSVSEGLKRVESTGTNLKKSAGVESQSAPMTIFYAGQVIVFNDLPADKAKEIMHLACQGSYQNNSVNPNPAKTNAPFTSTIPRSPIESELAVTPNVAVPPNVAPNFINSATQECIQPAQRTIPGALPIARKASLHRFLEKRKDRITMKAPYPKSSSGAAPSNPGDGKSWLGLAAQSLQ